MELKPKINPELVKKYREIFDGYDKEQTGFVLAKDVPGVMRILGVAMTENEGTSFVMQSSRALATGPRRHRTRSSQPRLTLQTSWVWW